MPFIVIQYADEFVQETNGQDDECLNFPFFFTGWQHQPDTTGLCSLYPKVSNTCMLKKRFELYVFFFLLEPEQFSKLSKF